MFSKKSRKKQMFPTNYGASSSRECGEQLSPLNYGARSSRGYIGESPGNYGLESNRDYDELGFPTSAKDEDRDYNWQGSASFLGIRDSLENLRLRRLLEKNSQSERSEAETDNSIRRFIRWFFPKPEHGGFEDFIGDTTSIEPELLGELEFLYKHQQSITKSKPKTFNHIPQLKLAGLNKQKKYFIDGLYDLMSRTGLAPDFQTLALTDMEDYDGDGFFNGPIARNCLKLAMFIAVATSIIYLTETESQVKQYFEWHVAILIPFFSLALIMRDYSVYLYEKADSV